MKHLGYILTKTGIFFLCISPIFGVYFFKDSLNFQVVLGVSWLSATLIIASEYFLYDRPIKSLELGIKKFLVGTLKSNTLEFPRSINPGMNYILLFFERTLGTLKNIKSEFLHGKEIKGEVELAKEIQERMLKKDLHEVPFLEIVAKSKPAGEIGGDSYDVISQGENHYIYVGDATGHGVGAGFIMMMVNALISAYSKVTSHGNQILSLANDIIKPRVKANLLMSLLLVRWNSEEKKLYMTGAGHEYLMIYKHAHKKCYKLKSGGVALGMTKNIHKLLKEQEILFEPNDVMILYSDGVTEAINRPQKDGSEEMFGENRLTQAIENAPEIGSFKIRTARSIFKNISIELSRFMGYSHVQLDDITLVAAQYISPEYNKNEDCSEQMQDDFVTEWKW